MFFAHTVSIPSHQNNILRCISDCFTLYFTLCSPLYFTLYFTPLLLPSATKLRRLCFYRCLSVHGGDLSQCILGYTPLGRHIPLDRDPTSPSRRRLMLQQTATAADGRPPTGMHSCCIFHALFHALFLIQLHTCTFCVTLCFMFCFTLYFTLCFRSITSTPGQQISAKTGDFVAVYKAQTGSAKLWIRTPRV